MNARVDRPFVSLREVLSPTSRNDRTSLDSWDEVANCLDVRASVSDNSRQREGDTPCDILAEAAFDILGAARFVRGGNVSFARQSLQSALDELTHVAGRLGVAR